MIPCKNNSTVKSWENQACFNTLLRWPQGDNFMLAQAKWFI